MLCAIYTRLAAQLQPQVQGTCGIYSFYNAVCILRVLDSRNPAVPPPKKGQAKADDDTSGAFTSLRQYSKRQLHAGQGEVLTEREMLELVSAHGYMPLTFSRRGSVTENQKKDFIETCIKANHPVLVAYLADSVVGAGVKYVGAVTKDCGAHWSLVIGLDGKNVKVIEPNAPKVLKVWSLADLMKSNAKTDDKKFAEFWAKTVRNKQEFDRETGPADKKGAAIVKGRGVEPYAPDPKAFKPSWDETTKKGKVKLYDLGGTDQKRQDKQDLNHVLIAIVPPFLPAPARTK